MVVGYRWWWRDHDYAEEVGRSGSGNHLEYRGPCHVVRCRPTLLTAATCLAVLGCVVGIGDVGGAGRVEHLRNGAGAGASRGGAHQAKPSSCVFERGSATPLAVQRLRGEREEGWEDESSDWANWTAVQEEFGEAEEGDEGNQKDYEFQPSQFDT